MYILACLPQCGCMQIHERISHTHRSLCSILNAYSWEKNNCAVMFCVKKTSHKWHFNAVTLSLSRQYLNLKWYFNIGFHAQSWKFETCYMLKFTSFTWAQLLPFTWAHLNAGSLFEENSNSHMQKTAAAWPAQASQDTVIKSSHCSCHRDTQASLGKRSFRFHPKMVNQLMLSAGDLNE